jgi:hypothetical protein
MIEQKIVQDDLPSFVDLFGSKDKSVVMDVNDLADNKQKTEKE